MDLYVRQDGLEDFVRAHAKVDRKQLVEVKKPERDMRAFVRLALPMEPYVKYQEQWLHDLKRKLMQQKTEDIMAEIDAEVAAFKGSEGEDPAPEAQPAAPARPAPRPDAAAPVRGADDAFNELERELQK